MTAAQYAITMRRKPPGTESRREGAPSSQPRYREGRRHLLHARPPGSRSRHSGDSSTSGSPPSTHAHGAPPVPRGSRPGRRAAPRPPPRLPDQLGRGSVGRDAARIGRPTGRTRTPSPRGRPCPGRLRRGSAEGAPPSPAAARATRRAAHTEELEALAEPQAGGPVAVGLAEVAQEACDDVELGVVQRPQERRGSRRPKSCPCGDPEAVGRPALEAGDVVEVGAVRDRHHRSGRVEPLVSSLIASETHVMASARDATRRATRSCSAAFAFVAVVSACGGRGDERVAQVGHPADPVAARSPPRSNGSSRAATWRRRRRSRARARAGSRPGSPWAPGGVLVGVDQAPQLEPARVTARSSPCVPARTSVGLPPLHRRSARDAPRLGRQPEALVSMQPARVVGCEDVRLDPIAGRYCASFSGRCRAPPAGRK